MNILELSELTNAKRMHRDAAFEAVVSNPPYQRETGNGAVAIYHFVMEIAELLGEHISMIYPARWTNTGRGEGLDNFRNNELISKHYRKFIIHPRESEVFKDATIKGGVNYFLWDKKETDTTEYIYGGITQIRTTLLNDYPMMIVDPRFSKIVQKVNPENFIMVTPRNYYGNHLEADHSIEKLASTKNSNDPGTRIFYSGKGGGIRQTTLPKNSGKHSDEGYKTIVSRTADPDKRNNTLRRQNRLFIISPGEIVSGSFLQAGKFEKYEEALFCAKYLRTEFAMFLLGVITPTQNTVRGNYRLIPDIDFSTGEIKDKQGTFLNSNNLDTLNEQLFKIYELTEEEQKLILQSVKQWKDDSSIDVENLL